MGWRSPGRAEQSIIDRAEIPSSTRPKHYGDCVQAFPRVSEALVRRVGLAERCRISVLSGEPARPIHARQSTRVALLSSLLSRERPTHYESEARRPPGARPAWPSLCTCTSVHDRPLRRLLAWLLDASTRGKTEGSSQPCGPTASELGVLVAIMITRA